MVYEVVVVLNPTHLAPSFSDEALDWVAPRPLGLSSLRTGYLNSKSCLRAFAVRSCFELVYWALGVFLLRNRRSENFDHQYHSQNSCRPHRCGAETGPLLRIAQMRALASD